MHSDEIAAIPGVELILESGKSPSVYVSRGRRISRTAVFPVL